MVNKKFYPWAPFDPEASLEDQVAYLKNKNNLLEFENKFLDDFLSNCDGWVYEIARSLPAPEPERQAFNSRVTSMATYWRWQLWEDCMADVPNQVERCLQALVGSAFDNERK